MGKFSLKKELRRRIARNVVPHGYGHELSAIEAVLRDKPEHIVENGAYLSNVLKRVTGIGEIPPQGFVTRESFLNMPEMKNETMARIDALNLTMGQNQEYNTFARSRYMPSQSTDKNASYMTAPEAVSKLRNPEFVNEAISWISAGKPGRGMKMKYIYPSDDVGVAKLAPMWFSGGMKIDMGEDENGKYISVYDKNDYNPFQNSGNKRLRKIGKKTEAIQTPFEIYDRIYFDIDKDGNAIILDK